MNLKQKIIVFGGLVILTILFVPFQTIQIDNNIFTTDNFKIIEKYLCNDSDGNLVKPPPFCNYTDSTTDTFKITYSKGKTVNVKLNIKKLFTVDTYGSATFPLKTNLSKTLFFI